jgi:hypothetical protein
MDWMVVNGWHRKEVGRGTLAMGHNIHETEIPMLFFHPGRALRIGAAAADHVITNVFTRQSKVILPRSDTAAFRSAFIVE